jgi:hypothetical protein
MRSILRSSLSAVAVAASATLLSLPAAAQVFVPSQPYGGLPAIDNLVIQIQGPDVQHGEYVRYRLYGTPGGSAQVHVPNLRDSVIALQEVAPGIYETTRFVRHDENPDGWVMAQGALQSAGKRTMAPINEVQNLGGFGYAVPANPANPGVAPGWGRRWNDGRDAGRWFR